MRKQLWIVLLLAGGCLTTVRAQQADAPFLPREGDAACKAWVDSVMKRLSVRDKIGQLLIMTLPAEASPKWTKRLQEAVKKHRVGGLLFGHGTAEEQAILTNRAQREADVPLLITFDGEWGSGMRLKEMADFPMNASLGCIDNDSLIYAYGREVARELHALGVHVNFAPDADVNINPKNPVINRRSFGENPRRAAAKVVAYGRGLEAGGVLSVSKHFPGHGDTDVDSHKALPVLPFSRARLDSIELVPFRAAIGAGLGGMMVGHLQVPLFEPDGETPSSLSHTLVTSLLKEELGFRGLVFTDALEMKGVSDVPQVTTKALLAGNDMLLAQNTLDKAVKELQQAVRQNKLTREALDAKCRKVLTYKYMLGLSRRPEPLQVSGISYRMNTVEAKTLAAVLRREAVTLLDGRVGMLPLALYQGTPVAVLSVGAGTDSVFVSELQRSTPIHIERFTLSAADSTEADIRRLATALAHYRRVVVSVTGPDTEQAPYAERLQQLALPTMPIYVFFNSYRAMLALDEPLKRAGAAVLAHSGEPDLQQYVAAILFGRAR
ncbi:MAG: beta-N-acetylglucosaminidase, partial [Prevotellaceae bacterium]|nr:beta-N-acetylglucosaminidase [Prevotellaceae bacterium]